MTEAVYRSRAEAIGIRTEACRCTAQALAGRSEIEGLPSIAWCLAVFFESYIAQGATATHKDFGPKAPTKLRLARKYGEKG
jgi:hypothetical protein